MREGPDPVSEEKHHKHQGDRPGSHCPHDPEERRHIDRESDQGEVTRAQNRGLEKAKPERQNMKGPGKGIVDVDIAVERVPAIDIGGNGMDVALIQQSDPSIEEKERI